MKRSFFFCFMLLLLSLCVSAGAELFADTTPAPTPEMTIGGGDTLILMPLWPKPSRRSMLPEGQ